MKLKALNKNIKLLESGGETPGKIEIADITAQEALKFINNLIQNKKNVNDLDISKLLHNFESKFNKAQTLASKGYTKRKDMPVIDTDQINLLQQRLENGHLDVVDHINNTIYKAFPKGLKDTVAEEWLLKGLADDNLEDDIITVTKDIIAVEDLTPIQEQIYFDKSIKTIIKYGIIDTIEFLTNVNESIIIISEDGYILDGHHRWLSAMLIDPKLAINVVKIDIDKESLVNLLNAYSLAIGNKHNG